MKIKVDAQINKQQTEIWACGQVIARASYDVTEGNTCKRCMFDGDIVACVGMPCSPKHRKDGMAVVWEVVE